MNIDTLLNLSSHVPSAAIGAVIGFLIKSFLEGRRKKKELHVNSINALKKAKGVLSSKILTIKQDLVLVNPDENIRSMRKNLDEDFLKSSQELIKLGKDRIIDNCDDINNINTDEFHAVFPDVAETIEELKNHCRNLKRIIKYKSADESKIYLLDEVKGNLSEVFSELMNETREIY